MNVRLGFAASIVGVTVCLWLTGCGSSNSAAPTPLKAAPEPVSAPPLVQQPAGKSLALPADSNPEGAVFDPGSGLVVIGLRRPDRLAFFDVRTQSLAGLFPVAGSARHLALASAGKVLVPAEDTDQVLAVTLPSGVVSSSVRTLKQPHDIAVVSANEWYVADEFGPAVSHVLDGQVTQTFTGLLQPGGAAAVDRTAAVVDVRGRLLFLYRDGREIARLPAGAGPTHVVSVGHNMLVVADTTGAKLLIYDVSVKPRLISTLDTPPGPYGMAYDERRGDLYVTATGTNELIRYSVNDASNGGEGGAVLTESGRYPTVRNPYSVAVDDSGSVVVVGADPPILQLIQP